MKEAIENTPQKSCANCHFLVWNDKGSAPRDNLDSQSTQTLKPIERADICSETPFEGIHFEPSQVCCAKGVWEPIHLNMDEYEKSREEWVKDIVTQDRGESCFFYFHTNGLSLMAAQELEKRQADRREGERDRQHFREQAQKDREAHQIEAKKDRRATRKLVWATLGLVIATLVLALVSFWSGT